MAITGWIKVRAGVLAPNHVRAIGHAWPVYLWLIHEDRDGTGRKVSERAISRGLGLPRGTVREYIGKLEKGGYIEVERKVGRGLNVTVLKNEKGERNRAVGRPVESDQPGGGSAGKWAVGRPDRAVGRPVVGGGSPGSPYKQEEQEEQEAARAREADAEPDDPGQTIDPSLLGPVGMAPASRSELDRLLEPEEIGELARPVIAAWEAATGHHPFKGKPLYEREALLHDLARSVNKHGLDAILADAEYLADQGKPISFGLRRSGSWIGSRWYDGTFGAGRVRDGGDRESAPAAPRLPDAADVIREIYGSYSGDG